MTKVLVSAAVLVLAVAVIGTTRGVERERYVAANEALYAELPIYPGSQVRSVTSSGYRDEESGPVIGYGTLYLVALPEDAEPDEVAAFFEGELEPEWTRAEKVTEPPYAAGPILSFGRGEARVGINLESWRAHVLEVYVDHEAK